MVRLGDAVGAAAAVIAMPVTKLYPLSRRGGIPPLDVLYTSDEEQATRFLTARFKSKALGLDMQWKLSKSKKDKEPSRSSFIQIASGNWVLIYDLLPMPTSGLRAMPLSDQMCKFLNKSVLYGMELHEDAARLAFELDCAIESGVNLVSAPFPGMRSGSGLQTIARNFLNITLRGKKVPSSDWEQRPVTEQQVAYMAEQAYLHWAVADHFLSKNVTLRSRKRINKVKIWGASEKLRQSSLSLHTTRYKWTKEEKEWPAVQKRIEAARTRNSELRKKKREIYLAKKKAKEEAKAAALAEGKTEEEATAAGEAAAAGLRSGSAEEPAEADAEEEDDEGGLDEVDPEEEGPEESENLPSEVLETGLPTLEEIAAAAPATDAEAPAGTTLQSGEVLETGLPTLEELAAAAPTTDAEAPAGTTLQSEEAPTAETLQKEEVNEAF